MSLISLIVLLIVVGVVLALVPMDATIKKIVVGLVTVVVVLCLLSLLFGHVPDVHIGK